MGDELTHAGTPDLVSGSVEEELARLRERVQELEDKQRRTGPE
jgi:hypothetical protein